VTQAELQRAKAALAEKEVGAGGSVYDLEIVMICL
jgi:hypothetical protein